MAGHSKWANIKHKKAAQDSKRGKAFTRLTKEITVAARVGGGDPTNNPRLRHLIEKARDINMPLDNVQRAIKRGTGEIPGVSYEPHMYEGYGPHGIAVIVDTLTDNKNRTVAEMRRLFSSNGGSMGDSGTVNWMFAKCGVVRATSAQVTTEESILEVLLDYDINDIEINEQNVTVTCDIKSLESVKSALKNASLTIESAEIEWVAHNTLSLSGQEEEKAIAFLEKLEEQEDVQNVYTNLA